MRAFSENKRDELQHYGVLGMRWGVRKSQSELRKGIRSAKKEKREWDEVAKTASTKRFLGNPSTADIANAQSKHYEKKISKLEAKIAAREKKGEKITNKIMDARKERNEWREELKTASTKRFLGNKSTADIIKDIIADYDFKIIDLQDKQKKYL